MSSATMNTILGFDLPDFPEIKLEHPEGSSEAAPKAARVLRKLRLLMNISPPAVLSL
jgi:hypothetical protein